ncbi:MAG: cupin domain-containing protein [Candidatus Thorarchaeota archaeon]|nr:MAG: cupin domain-containing protein [Candidatus Thorarchaeota archaeon]
MDNDSKYSISTDVEFGPLELIDIPGIIDACEKQWQNLPLSNVNDCVIRLGVIEGDFHWHKHDREDEFFYVVSGSLLIDLEDKTVELNSRQGFMVPRGIKHRTRAPERTAILMVEGSTVKPTGD